MSVYVDGLMTHDGRQWCHMLADTSEELEAMARKLGLAPIWRQRAATPREHYDLSPRLRGRALELGAKSIGWRDAAAIVTAKRAAIRAAHARQLAARPQKTAAAPRKAGR